MGPLGGEPGVLARLICLFAYLSLNSGLNMMNRWLLGVYRFRFPLFLSIAHLTFCFVLLAPVMLLNHFRALHRPTLEKQWLGLLVIGLCFALNLGLNNTSLVTISLSLNQVIRSSLPVLVAAFAVVIERKVPTRLEAAALLLLTVGVMIAAYQGSKQEDSLRGVLICVASTVSNAVMISTSGKVLSEKLDVIRLTFYTAPVTVAALLPCFFVLEQEALRAYAVREGMTFVPILVIGCCIALSYNLVHHLMIQWTSSVAVTVIGEMKVLILLALSAVLLNEAEVWTAKMSFGFVLALSGFSIYSHARLSARVSPGKAVNEEESVGPSSASSHNNRPGKSV